MAKPPAPELRDQIDRPIHAHEVFLCFVNDEDALAFVDWWDAEGLRAWQKWTEETSE